MITRLYVSNFKSLENFWFPNKEGQPLTALTAVVGMNGSGKSTLLQAFDFLGQLASGAVSAWLESRNWKASDLLSAFPAKRSRSIQFSLSWTDKKHGEIIWKGRYNTQTARCTQELIGIVGSSNNLLYVNGQEFSALNKDLKSEFKGDNIPFEYEGSIMSALKLDNLHPALKSFKVAVGGLKSLELLSPHLMRKRAKTAGDVGLGGEKLSAFLSTLDKESLDGLNRHLQKFYPQVKRLRIKSLKAGWKELWVEERYRGAADFSATQLNDGMLRIIGILSQAFTKHSVVLFDEIENGVNQQLVEMLMNCLVEISAFKQIIVTTHSPLILNFLPDDKAREGVIFLYKDNRGATHARRFFDLEQVAWKLDGLGPGEVFVDTDLVTLSEELAAEEGVTA